MLRAMGIDLRDGERSRPSQDQGKEKQKGKKNNKVRGAGDTRFQPEIDVDFLHPHSLPVQIEADTKLNFFSLT
jgi:hypothetical protein